MTEFIKNMSVFRTHIRERIPFNIAYPAFKDFTSEANLQLDYAHYIEEYLFQIQWRMHAKCQHKEADRLSQMGQTQLMRDLYGEVHDAIYEIKKHLYSRNLDAALQALDNLEEQIS